MYVYRYVYICMCVCVCVCRHMCIIFINKFEFSNFPFQNTPHKILMTVNDGCSSKRTERKRVRVREREREMKETTT